MIKDINNNTFFTENIFEITQLLEGAKGGISNWGQRVVYLQNRTETINLDQLANHYIKMTTDRYKTNTIPTEITNLQTTNLIDILRERKDYNDLLFKLQGFYNESDASLKQTIILKYLFCIFNYIRSIIHFLFNVQESQSSRAILFGEPDWEQPLAPKLIEHILTLSKEEYSNFFLAKPSNKNSRLEELSLAFYISHSKISPSNPYPMPLPKVSIEQIKEKITELENLKENARDPIAISV